MVNVLTMTTRSKVMLLHTPSCDLINFNMFAGLCCPRGTRSDPALEDVPSDDEDGQALRAAERDFSHAAQQAATAASASPEVLLYTSKKAHSFSNSSPLCIPVSVSCYSVTTSKVL